MVLKGLHKFKVDMPINAKVIAVQSLEHPLYIYILAVMLVGKRMPFSLTSPRQENCKPLWPVTLFLFGANNYKFSAETH